MLPIEYGDGFLKDLDQRSDVRAAQLWLNTALSLGDVNARVAEGGKWGHGSQAALDALRRATGLEDATGTALTVETLAVLGDRLDHPWIVGAIQRFRQGPAREGVRGAADG